MRIDGDHLTAQMPQQAGDDGSDVARTDHRCGLAGHVETDETVQ